MKQAFFVATVCVLTLSACALNPFGSAPDPDDGFVAGQNLVDEDCRALPNAAAQRDLGAARVLDIQCGTWEAPSARLAVFNAADLAGGTEPALWRQQLDKTALCDGATTPVEWRGGTGQLYSCRLREGSQWPYEARLLERGGQLYGIQGIPAAIPPAEFAAAVLAGTASLNDLPDPGTLDQTALAYEARIGARLFSVGDVFAFIEIMDYAQYLNAQGLHADALEQYERALDLQARVLPGDDPRLAEVLMVLALGNSNLERFGVAQTQFSRARALSKETIDPNVRARLTSYEAFDKANQQDFQGALALARRASAERQEIIASYLRGGVGATLVSFDGSVRTGEDLGTTYGLTALGDLLQSRYLEGAMLRRLGRLDDAAAVARDAERSVAQYPKLGRDWRQKLRQLRAEIAEQQGNLTGARSILGEIIAAERARSVDSHLQALTLIDRGRLAFAAGDRAAGFADTEAGLAIIERSQQSLPIEAMVPFYDAVLAEPGGENAAALYTRAFSHAQLVRSTVVAQTMRQSFARLAAADTDGGQAIRDLQDLRRLRDTITDDLTLARSQGEAFRADALQRAYDAAARRIAEKEQAVQAALPRYNLIVDAPVPAERLQASLREGEGVVMFQVAAEKTYGFLVTRNDLAIFPVAVKADALDGLIRTLRYAMDERPGARYDLAVAAQTYSMLFGPVQSRIASLDTLVVAPSGALQSMPFSLLVKSHDGRPRTTYQDVDWLIRSHAIAVVPSVQAFHLNRTGATTRGTPVPFAGFVGGAYGTAQGPGVARRLNLPTSCEEDLSALFDLPPLTGAEGEVSSIVARVGDRAETFALDTLTEERLKSLPLDQYRVVHFATHGLFPGELDCLPEPALVVGLPETPSADDGLLTAAEITNLSLNADLVVLSACNTGVVLDEFGGESLASLSRSFLYAGARGLLVSHWYVSDDATQTLMVGIFDRLKEGKPAVDAVREAKLAMIANPRTSHPYLWSAFSYLGDGASPIDL